MLKRLYELGYLDLSKVILDNYKDIDINPTEAVILIKMLELDKSCEPILTSSIARKTGMTTVDIQNSLVVLMEKNLYEIYLEYDKGIGQEKYNFNQLFRILEEIFKQKITPEVDATDMKVVMDLIEGELKRNVTPIELEMIRSWLDTDKFTVLDVKNALVEVVSSGKVNIKSINRSLQKERNKSLGETPKLKDTERNGLLQLFNTMKS